MEVSRILSTGPRVVLGAGARLGRNASRITRKGVKRTRKRLRRGRRRLLRHLRLGNAKTLSILSERPRREALEERATLPTLPEEGLETLEERATLPTLPEEGLETDEADATQADAFSILRIPDELLRRGNLDLVNWLFREDYLMHDLESGKEFRGIDGYKEYATLVRRALADILVSVHRQEVRGDRIVTQYTVRGTHTGRLLGRFESGITVQVSGRLVTRLAAGMIAEEWNSYDASGLRRQLEAGGAVASRSQVAPALADVGR